MQEIIKEFREKFVSKYMSADFEGFETNESVDDNPDKIEKFLIDKLQQRDKQLKDYIKGLRSETSNPHDESDIEDMIEVSENIGWNNALKEVLKKMEL